MPKETKVETRCAGDLVIVSAKLKGMGFLLKNQDGSGEPPDREVNYGIGQILTEIAEEIEDFAETLQNAMIQHLDL